MDEHQSQTIFTLLNKPHKWHAKAMKLKYCADVLFDAFLKAQELSREEQAETEDTDINDVATLLYGMAMENILKALLLKTGVAQPRSDGTVAWNAEGAGNHDLLAMSNSLTLLKLDSAQQKLMERLSAFVCWAGKYPTPLELKRRKHFQGFVLCDQPMAGKETLPVPFRGDDKCKFDEIFTLFDKHIKSGCHT